MRSFNELNAVLLRCSQSRSKDLDLSSRSNKLLESFLGFRVTNDIHLHSLPTRWYYRMHFAATQMLQDVFPPYCRHVATCNMVLGILGLPVSYMQGHCFQCPSKQLKRV